MGLIKQDSGEILVDGNKIDNLSPEWKKIIGFVPQDINLINGTLVNNIILSFDEEFDKKRLRGSYKFSQLKNFVNTLPGWIKYAFRRFWKQNFWGSETKNWYSPSNL